MARKMTKEIELPIDTELLIFLSEQATQGNPKAIALLDRFHLQPKEVIATGEIIYRKDGEVAAWIA